MTKSLIDQMMSAPTGDELRARIDALSFEDKALLCFIDEQEDGIFTARALGPTGTRRANALVAKGLLFKRVEVDDFGRTVLFERNRAAMCVLLGIED